jgi:hypothetical protein
MRLELKHLAPYLPYGLKYQVELKEIKLMVISTGNIHNILRAVNEGVYGNEYKPILRPLSDLNKKKQIAEYFCSFYDHLERINPSTHETKNCALMLDGTIEMQYYNDYQFLFAWHFDVFGLIEKGLAIDINTLK